MAINPTTPNFNPFATGQAELGAIGRQREMAKLLLQQGQQRPEGQLVSGRYVAPSFFQNLAPIVNQYAGQKKLEAADEAEKQLYEKQRQLRADELRRFTELSTGDAGVAPVEGPTPEGNNLSNTVTPRAPVAPNQGAALQFALQSSSPELRSLALKRLEGMKLAEGEQFFEPNLATGKSEATISGAPKLTNEQKDYNAAVAGGFKGSFFDYQRMLKQAGASNVTLSTEKSYGQAFGGKIAEQDSAKYDVALAAPKRIADADRTTQLLDSGAITGFGATWILNAARALGVNGKTNSELIKNTELLVSNRGQAVLSNIKTSGLGAGQGFTDKDRMFLENVVGGRIELSAGTLRELARLEKQAAIASANQWNDRFDRIPADVRAATGVHKVDVGAAPRPPAGPSAPGAPPSAPPAPGAAPPPKPGGRVVIDPAILHRYGLPVPR